MSRARTAQPEIAPVVWHDLECGAYAEDLPLWRELAARAAMPGRPCGRSCDVLDLGCGTGRVALDLAGHGHRVTGLDVDEVLAAELRRRAEERNVSADAVHADASDFDLGRRFDLVLAAMQLLQLFGDPAERGAILTRARAHLRRGGLFAAALLDLEGEVTGAAYVPPLPDMRERDGWVWSSQPVAIRVLDGGAAISLDRVRRAVSPGGEIVESDDAVRLELLSADEVERAMREAGLVPVERRTIRPTDDHVGSLVVIGESR
jgi:SAM-dependent methyltransferase